MKLLALRSVLLNCDDGSIALCFAKRIVDGGAVEHETPHRRVIPADGDISAEVDAVISHLASEGWQGDAETMKKLVAQIDGVARADKEIEAGRQRHIAAKAEFAARQAAARAER